MARQRRAARRRRPKDAGLSLSTRSRPVQHDRPAAPGPGSAPAAWRRSFAGAVTAVAALLVFLALVMPDQLGRYWAEEWVPGAFLRLPIEGIAGAALLLALPPRPR